VPCELGFRSSILMQQKDKALSRLFPKNCPQKVGEGKASRITAGLLVILP